jgi:hypothetical protein
MSLPFKTRLKKEIISIAHIPLTFEWGWKMMIIMTIKGFGYRWPSFLEGTSRYSFWKTKKVATGQTITF